MNDFGIVSFGAYIPRMRLDRGAIAAAHNRLLKKELALR